MALLRRRCTIQSSQTHFFKSPDKETHRWMVDAKSWITFSVRNRRSKKNFSRRRFGSLVFSHNSVLPLLRAPLAALSHYSLSSALLAAKLHKEETKYTRLDITFEAPSSFLRHGPFSQTADLKLPTEARARKRREKRDNRTTSRERKGEREREREKNGVKSCGERCGAELSLGNGAVDPSVRRSIRRSIRPSVCSPFRQCCGGAECMSGTESGFEKGERAAFPSLVADKCRLGLSRQ